MLPRKNCHGNIKLAAWEPADVGRRQAISARDVLRLLFAPVIIRRRAGGRGWIV